MAWVNGEPAVYLGFFSQFAVFCINLINAIQMTWNELTMEAQWSELLGKSESIPQLVFKHSTRCTISAMIRKRLERSETPAGIDFHFLDLIRFRDLSNKIAEDMGVKHQSPQVLLIWKEKCIYHESHNAIQMAEIAEQGKISTQH